MYPAPLGDLLLNLAEVGLYKPYWSDAINDEWLRSVLKDRPDIKRESLKRAIEAMNAAFPDARITHYESLVMGLELPDENDRHVIAAGIKVNVDAIVTFNKKDFPKSILKAYDIEVKHPDDFISELVELNQRKVRMAFESQVGNLKNPPMSKTDVVAKLKLCGLKKASMQLGQL